MASRCAGIVAAAGVVLTMAEAVAQPWAAELRRYEGNADCTGKYNVLDVEQMNQCSHTVIPPGSHWTAQINGTAYTSYHYNGTLNCAGTSDRTGNLITVGECQSFGDYSQKRVWLTSGSPTDATCVNPGVCGRAYQACCVGSAATLNACTCHLHNGTGNAGSRNCGTCGNAFVACCAAFELKGNACGCDINEKASEASTIVV